MLKKTIKYIAVSLVVAIMGTLFAGCNKAGNTASEVKKEASQTASEIKEESGEVTYPLDTSETFTYWVELHSNISKYAKNMSETEFAKELEKRTGVKIEYIHPATGQKKEAFNLLIASGDLPDMIEYSWLTGYPGGPNAALESGSILKLNDLIKNNAPNLTKYLNENKDINRDVKTDEGAYYCFPFIMGDESLLVTSGPIIRKDWLDDLGLEIPETIDEWETVLRAFKEKKGATAPLSFRTSGGQPQELKRTFMGAFGININAQSNFFVEDGEVKYGWLEPGVKDFLAKMKAWYDEGLLDKNFATIDKKGMIANLLSGKSGATYGSGGSGIGTWMEAGKKNDPKFELAGAKTPTLKKGELAKFSNQIQRYNGLCSVSISANCKNPELAARYLDYLYSEEGHIFANFGTEGLSYNMVDGYPTYTDEVMNNPDGLSVAQAMSKYIRGNMGGPFVQDKRYLEQFYGLPQQQAAVKNWIQHDHKKYQVPCITPTVEESSEFAKIISDLNTYEDEMLLKFIMGQEPLENVEKFQEQLKAMNVQRAIEIYQAALERYNNR